MPLKEYSIAWLIVVAVGMISYGFHQSEPASVVTLTPLTTTLKVGDTIQASAIAYDELGNAIPDAKIQWLPTADSGEHCVSVVNGVITARIPGSCGVGALTVTSAGKVILHETPISVTVAVPVPSPSPSPTATPCSRLPNGKCRKACFCI